MGWLRRSYDRGFEMRLSSIASVNCTRRYMVGYLISGFSCS